MSGSTRDLREAGALVSGAEVAGVVHRAFELRLPTVRDNIDAVDEVGSHNGVALNAAILRRQLVKLGTLEPKQITYELMCELHPADFNLLEAAASALEKKRLAVLPQAPTGAASGSPSSAQG